MFSNFRKRSSPPPHTVEEVLPRVNENLVDVGGELNVATLLAGYRMGAFPWTVNPVTWWSPDPRAIIEFHAFRPSRSLLKLLRKQPFALTIDAAFGEVIRLCARSGPRRRTTWITPEFIAAYSGMHREGHAHSLEVWQKDALVGGIYGVAIGGYFAGESMFHLVDDASKAALYYLVLHLRARGFVLLDIQMPTRITLQMGASLIPRREFLARLRAAQQLPATFGDSLEMSAAQATVQTPT
jgi:leucyl/phenylalanyl-tRNA---protein transferase